MKKQLPTAKPLTKEETKALLSLIEGSKIINNRTTNAITNKLKNDEWRRISDQFNSTVAIYHRTPQQLRLKWENLKKNYRKRSSLQCTNNSHTGDRGLDYLRPDEILERVESLLKRTADGLSVKLGGEAEPEKALTGVSASISGESDNDLGVESSLANTDTPTGLKHKLKSDENRAARNLAIAEYYVAKKKVLEAKFQNIRLENEKLKLEIEALKKNKD